MIGSYYKSSFENLFRPLARVFVKLNISPNQMTVAGLVFGIASCAIFLWTKNLALFFILIVASGLFDALDGVVARLTERTTKYGAYLDAMCDRLFDVAAAFTVAVHTGEWGLILLAVTGGVLVSYAKARASMEAPVSNLEWPDLMERLERNTTFIVGFFISELFQIQIAEHSLFFWVLIVLNVLIYFTVTQRITRAKHLIEERT